MSIKVFARARVSCLHISTDSCSLDTEKISGFGFFTVAEQFMSDKEE